MFILASSPLPTRCQQHSLQVSTIKNDSTHCQMFLGWGWDKVLPSSLFRGTAHRKQFPDCLFDLPFHHTLPCWLCFSNDSSWMLLKFHVPTSGLGLLMTLMASSKWSLELPHFSQVCSNATSSGKPFLILSKIDLPPPIFIPLPCFIFLHRTYCLTLC